MNSELKIKWANLKAKLSKDFSDDQLIDLDAIIFLIGLQELGQFQKKFNKQKKLEILHIAVCKLLSDYGYYQLEFIDQEGWPHYRLNENLPNLKPGEQTILIKKAIIKIPGKLNMYVIVVCPTANSKASPVKPEVDRSLFAESIHPPITGWKIAVENIPIAPTIDMPSAPDFGIFSAIKPIIFGQK